MIRKGTGKSKKTHLSLSRSDAEGKIRDIGTLASDSERRMEGPESGTSEPQSHGRHKRDEGMISRRATMNAEKRIRNDGRTRGQ
jgi:hypothetical protein